MAFLHHLKVSFVLKFTDLYHLSLSTKGQLISKAIYGVLDSPKKTNEKDLTWYIIVVTSQIFSFFCSFFFGEVRKTKIAFEIIWPLSIDKNDWMIHLQ